jgi:hypothetical protein
MNLLRKRLEREESTTAGLAIGRARRLPTDEERRRYCRSYYLRIAFHRGLRRGRNGWAKCEQLTLAGV